VGGLVDRRDYGNDTWWKEALGEKKRKIASVTEIILMRVRERNFSSASRKSKTQGEEGIPVYGRQIKTYVKKDWTIFVREGSQK